MSQPPSEGFEALVTLRAKPYHIRISAKCRERDNYGPLQEAVVSDPTFLLPVKGAK